MRKCEKFEPSPCVVAALLAAGCGDDSAVVDAGLPDAAPMDASQPDTSPLPDAGPPPACAGVATLVEAVPGYGEGSAAPPTGFAASNGRYAYTFASLPAAGTPAGDALHLAVVDGSGATLADETLEQVGATEARLSDSALGTLGGSFFAVWTRADLDAGGAVTGAEIHDAILSEDGDVLRPASVLYASAAAPHLVVNDAGGYLLRADLQLVSGTAVITPRVTHLDVGGDPVGLDVTLLSFLNPEATELGLALSAVGPTLLARVPPSQLFTVALSPEGGPIRTERRVDGFAFLDAFAAQGERVLAVATERAAGEGRVDAFLLDRDGTLVRHVELGRGGAVQPRAAAFAAWPGFAVAWREGAGDSAMVRAAGVDLDGNLIVPAQDLIAAPGATGPVFGANDGDGLALGFRQEAADGTASLALVRSCVPR